jgi:hypothetical protein
MADNSGFLNWGGHVPLITQKRGSDFTGADGAVNRTLAIVTETAGFEIWIDGRVLHITQEFTYDGATLTILLNLDNASYVEMQSFGVI